MILGAFLASTDQRSIQMARGVSTFARYRLGSMAAGVVALALGFTAPEAHANLTINPQLVVDDALKQGRRARDSDFQAQTTYLKLAQALGVFDLQLTFNPNYQYSRAQNITLFNDLSDRNLNFQTILEKKFRTGTTIDLEYDDNSQAAVLNQTSPTFNRTSNATLEVGILTVRQALWRNAFGYSDRLALAVARETIDAALKTRDQNIQQVALDAMTLFWNAYVSEQKLKQNVEAREKYRQLVSNVKRKAQFSLATAGELPRLEAALETQDVNVKSSSAIYLSDIDLLLTAMQVSTAEPVELQVPTTIPPVPKLSVKELEDLRPVQISRLQLQAAQNLLDATRSVNTAQVDLVAKAASTGVDEQSRAAYAQMASGTHPTYYIGVELKTALDSSLYRGQIANADVAVKIAENNVGIARDNLQVQLAQSSRLVNANFAAATASQDILKQRERVVHEIESAYRQGRQPLVELIRAYDELFSAQLFSATAIGDYHKSLNALAAARDELVRDEPVKR